jgi:hypothetical protein
VCRKSARVKADLDAFIAKSDADLAPLLHDALQAPIAKLLFRHTTRRGLIRLIGAAAVAARPLAACGRELGNYLHAAEKTTGLPEIKQSRLRVKLTALDRAEAIAELKGFRQKRLKAMQHEPSLPREQRDEAIKTTAEELGLTKNLVPRSIVIAGLSETAKAEAKRLGLDDSQTALYAAAKEPDPKSQIERLRLYC